MGRPQSRATLSDSATYLAVLGAAVCCYAALGAVLEILPRYVPERLGGGSALVGLAVGIPALTGSIGRPSGGRAADRFGPLAPMLVGGALMAVGGVPAALSTTLVGLLLSRLVVGLGEGVMMGAGVAWLLRLAGPERRGRALGHIGLANYAGLALGPLLAAALGGASATGTVLTVAIFLPLLGMGVALAVAGSAHDGTQSSPMAASSSTASASTSELLRRTAPPGLGLLFVNIGYVSMLSLGAATARAHGTALPALIVPVFASAVLVTRTAGGSIPDRLGGRRTACLSAAVAATGLLIFAPAATAPIEIAGLLMVAVGQSLAVPALGLLALARVPVRDQGAAAGLFFAWFDAGVGLGGPAVGLVASVAGPTGGMQAAAAAVAAVIAIAGVAGRSRAPAISPAVEMR